jgi:glycosyltransferase involved in cell wall biosynthesis
MKKIVLDISYIVSGGGKKYALKFIHQLKDDYDLTILSNNISVSKNATIWSNLINREIIIHKLNPDLILNISNVPYIFKKKYVIFFLHQRYYIDNSGLKYTRGSFRFKMKLKSLFFKTFVRSNYKIIVQTNVMREILFNKIRLNSKVCSFINFNYVDSNKKNQVLIHNDNVPHKKINWNHEIFRWIELNSYNLLVVGVQPPSNIKCNYLGYLEEPSMKRVLSESKVILTFTNFESLGLLYVEACLNKCILIAKKTDVINEVVNNYYNLDDNTLLNKKISSLEYSKFSKSFLKNNKIIKQTIDEK